MLKRHEEEKYYTTKYNSVKWYKITSRISIDIRIKINDSLLYDYRISSPCTRENAKKLAETIILNFDPQLIPTIKNEKPKIIYDRFWILI